MPVPIQPVTSFSESELWYMYQQLTEINANTSGGGGGLSQTEVYEIFNGTNPQGFAVSLFENISGTNISLANILQTINGDTIQILNELITSNINTLGIQNNTNISNTYLSNIDGTTQTIESYSQNIQNNTSTANTKLTSIDSKLTNVATTTLQTVGNNSLSSIDTNTSNIATNSAAINTNTANTTTAINTSNGYFSVLRTPVILSTSGTSAGINAQIHNIAFANVGAAAGTITVNGTTVSLPVGAVVEYNAGGLNNRFAVNSFGYNGTGTTLLIQYVN